MNDHINIVMKYFILLSLIFYSGCIPGPQDLGNGYVLGYNTNSLDRVIQINSPSGGIKITYYKSKDTIETYFKNEDWIVDSYVTDAVYDEKFILIDQKPIDSICECNQKCLEKKYKNWNDLPTYKMCKDAIENSNTHLFYVIDKIKNILYGPMSKDDLNNKIGQLHIDNKLRLSLK